MFKSDSIIMWSVQLENWNPVCLDSEPDNYSIGMFIISKSEKFWTKKCVAVFACVILRSV